MNTDAIKDFEKTRDADKQLIEEYRGLIPQEMITVWEQYGFGSFMNGYLKVINPRDYAVILKEGYFLGDVSVPLFATAFGDLIVWREKRFLDIVLFRYGDSDVMLETMEFFFDLLCDEPEEFIDDFFAIDKYNAAVKMHGQLARAAFSGRC